MSNVDGMITTLQVKLPMLETHVKVQNESYYIEVVDHNLCPKHTQNNPRLGMRITTPSGHS